MLFLKASEQRQIFMMEEAIEAVGIALREYSSQRAITPVRTFIPVEKENGTSIFMPSLVQATGSLGFKFVSVFPNNKHKNKKTINGIMVLAHIETGEPLALLEASYLTVLRTGAASGLATKLLSREDSKVLSVIGTGAQSRGIIEGVLTVRPMIEEIRLYNRSKAKAHVLAEELIRQYGHERFHISVFNDADRAVHGSTIVITATNSPEPVFSDAAIEPGVHVNAVGSYLPTMQELPTRLMKIADKIVVESREAALEETGDLLIPIKQGEFHPEQIYGEIGEILSGMKQGRERQDEITVFESVGLATMDVVLAKFIYDLAVQAGVGQHVRLDS